MKRFHILCLAVATAEILVVAFVLWNHALQSRAAENPLTAQHTAAYMTEETAHTVQAAQQENGSQEMTAQSVGTEADSSETSAAAKLLMRVKLKTSDYTSYEHEQVTISCADTFHLQCGGKEQIFTGGQTVTVTLQHPFFQEGGITVYTEGAALVIDSIVHRGASHDYEGTLELYAGSGGIVIINQLELEQYVSRVVPSEMPASYGVEAAMLQAVCARTYAYERILNQKTIDAYGAYADDSVEYQVYNSAGYQAVSEEGTKQTEGIVMLRDGAPIVPYYFSTSCGYTTDNLAWSGSQTKLPYLNALNLTGGGDLNLTDEAAASAFFQNWDAPGLESSMAWFRWRCEITVDTLEMLLDQRLRQLSQSSGERVTVNGGTLEQVLASGFRDICVTERFAGGMAAGVKVSYRDGDITVTGELNIRRLLSEPERTYRNKSQEEVALSEGAYLPSAFFCLVPTQKDGQLFSYVICGGGNGHGIGLSQNAAYVMLEQGRSWQEILTFFYQGIAFSKIK